MLSATPPGKRGRLEPRCDRRSQTSSSLSSSTRRGLGDGGQIQGPQTDRSRLASDLVLNCLIFSSDFLHLSATGVLGLDGLLAEADPLRKKHRMLYLLAPEPYASDMAVCMSTDQPGDGA
ncbi:unnamed protein product [Pleuronectes platessa]|uniref:Uncharacterized protein n=1 Tax=Pleuronectes platessa TaxID=8262 RepID=A0A9N7TXS7_PLEPL|nr:unnamed protein product [Pleuronectes platessa]